MKKVLMLLLSLLVIFIGGCALLKLPAVQDVVLARGTALIAERGSAPFPESESLRVYVCGSASPLGMGQAQACIAVITPEHFYLIDSGAGSTDNINRLGLPTERLQGLLLTHFHSDHIAEIYEVNLGSWVRGRPAPLTVYGPRGVDEVTNAVNAGYRQDRIYRTGHHGEDLLPSFLLYAPLIRMNGGEVRYIPTRAENNHQLDPQEVIDAMDVNTHAIILNSPSNPTGTVYPRETIETIVQEAAYRGIYVISDEVYDHLIYDNKEYASVLSCCSDLDHVMVASSFSKTFSMAGMRIGWLIASQGTIKKLRRYHMFTTTVANTPCQWGGVAALNGDRSFVDEMVTIYQKRRDRLVELVEKTPHLQGYVPQGAFYLFPSLPEGINGTNVALRLLKETGVCTIAGDTFGDSCANALRFSYATSIEEIERAFERIIPWMEKQDFN